MADDMVEIWEHVGTEKHSEDPKIKVKANNSFMLNIMEPAVMPLATEWPKMIQYEYYILPL